MVKIKIYTTKTCPYCKMEKDYLDSKGIKYENVFVDEDTNAVAELMGMSGQLGVPFNVITGEDGSKETILGYDRQRLNKILEISEG